MKAAVTCLTTGVVMLGIFGAPVCLMAQAGPCAPLTEKQIHRNRHITASDAAQYATYAILSDSAYPRDHPIPLPPGWTKVGEKLVPDTGLALVVCERHVGPDLAEVAVVFRGSDERTDWIHNLTPFFRIQVPPAEKEFTVIVDRYNRLGPKIVAAGHSLGGGLAFHMSFVYPNVEAIAFNSSPVTKAGSKVQPNKRTSIWESGEGLQAPRNAVNFARIRWHDVKRVEVEFLTGSPVKQHRMGDLALNLTKLAARESSQFQSILTAFCQAEANRRGVNN
jgi:hypothetical protein